MAPRRRSAADATTKPCTEADLRRVDRRRCGGRAVRVRHRDHASTTCRRRSSASRSRRARHRRLRAADARLRRRARRSSIGDAVLQQLCSRCSKTSSRRRSATTSSTTRTCCASARHRAARHALRLDARVVRVEQHRDAPRHRRGRGALSRHRDDSLRRRRRQGREADPVQPGAGRQGRRILRRGRRRRAAAAPVLWPQSPACRRCALYEEIEQPLVPVLLRMEQAACCSTADAAAAEPRARERLAKSKRARTRKPARPFNLDSPKQLRRGPVRQAAACR